MGLIAIFPTYFVKKSRVVKLGSRKRQKQQLKEVGFVIANDREEFLHSSKTQPGLRQVRGWTLILDFAKVYPTRALALEEVKRLDVPYPVWVLILLESEGQIAVASDDENGPSWLDSVFLNS